MFDDRVNREQEVVTALFAFLKHFSLQRFPSSSALQVVKRHFSETDSAVASPWTDIFVIPSRCVISGTVIPDSYHKCQLQAVCKHDYETTYRDHSGFASGGALADHDSP